VVPPRLGEGALPVTGNLARVAARRLAMAGDRLPASAAIGLGAIVTDSLDPSVEGTTSLHHCPIFRHQV
jgi:hypothetical protein